MKYNTRMMLITVSLVLMFVAFYSPPASAVKYVSTASGIDHGSTSTPGSLADVIDDNINSDDETIILCCGTTYNVETNLTIPENVNLKFQDGAVLAADGCTVTINGPITAGWYKIFDLQDSGSIRIGTGWACPQWFGAETDDGSSDETAIKNAWASLFYATGSSGTLYFPPGVYDTLAEIDLSWSCSGDFSILGAGPNSIIKTISTTISIMKITYSDSGCEDVYVGSIQGLHFDGGKTGFESDVLEDTNIIKCGFTNFKDFGIKLTSSSTDSIIIKSCMFYKAQASGYNIPVYWAGDSVSIISCIFNDVGYLSANSPSENSKIIGNTFNDINGATAIYGNGAKKMTISRNNFTDIAKSVIYTDGCEDNIVADNTFNDVVKTSDATYDSVIMLLNDDNTIVSGNNIDDADSTYAVNSIECSGCNIMDNNIYAKGISTSNVTSGCGMDVPVKKMVVLDPATTINDNSSAEIDIEIKANYFSTNNLYYSCNGQINGKSGSEAVTAFFHCRAEIKHNTSTEDFDPDDTDTVVNVLQPSGDDLISDVFLTTSGNTDLKLKIENDNDGNDNSVDIESIYIELIAADMGT